MLEIHDDIQTAMSQPLSDDGEDLEDELAQLLEENEESRKPGHPETDADVKQLEDEMKKLNLPSTPKEKRVLSQSVVGV